MIKQTSCSLTALIFLFLLTAPLFAEIYRVVDKDGNVTYTNQPPGDGSAPMDLPELSVIQSANAENQMAENSALQQESAEIPSLDLQRLYSDFQIVEPQNEETFWGTANSIVVSWDSDTPLQPGMTVKLFVNGVPRDVTGSASTSLQLDRGTHQVKAELFNGGNKPLITTPTVTFFVKQASIGVNSISVPPDGT